MAITKVTKVGADVLMSALGWRQSSTVLESVGEERRLVTPWSGVELYPCTAHRARSLSSARRQPAQLKQCSAGHHTCEPCITMSYNIQRYLLVETVHFSVESIALSMVKHVAKHGLHVCRRFCLSLGCAIPSSSTSLYLDIYCI